MNGVDGTYYATLDINESGDSYPMKGIERKEADNKLNEATNGGVIDD